MTSRIRTGVPGASVPVFPFSRAALHVAWIALGVLALAPAARGSTPPQYVVTVIAPLPGASSCSAIAISSNGKVVGFCQIGAQTTLFLYSDGAVTAIGSGAGRTATGVNALGRIVGNFTQLPGSPFLYSGGVFTTLPELPTNPNRTSLNSALGINNLGQVVGESSSHG